MSAENYLRMIQQDIHSVVFATTDGNNFLVTCVIDIMLADKEGLYFLTAKGKALIPYQSKGGRYDANGKASLSHKIFNK